MGIALEIENLYAAIGAAEKERQDAVLVNDETAITAAESALNLLIDQLKERKAFPNDRVLKAEIDAARQKDADYSRIDANAEPDERDLTHRMAQRAHHQYVGLLTLAEHQRRLDRAALEL